MVQDPECSHCRVKLGHWRDRNEEKTGVSKGHVQPERLIPVE